MKTLEEIYQGLAADFLARTGASAAGCGDLAARFYAVAAQLYGLYAQADWTRRQCFPQTAEGEELDKHAWLRGVSRQSAVKAGGVVRFYVDSQRELSTNVPAGTVCMTAEGVRFVTVQALSIPAGETEGEAAVEAVEAGAAGNVPANAVLFLAVPPVGVTACANPQPMTGGLDAEGDASLRQRVLDSYRRLANGANSAFYEQTAMAFDGVAAVTVLPRSRGVGTVDVVVAAQNGMPDEGLLAQLQEHFSAVREIAVDVAVKVQVKAGEAFSAVSARVETALRGWFTGERLGSPVLKAELTALVFGVGGVANCAVTLPDSDTAGENTVLPVLGTLTVTEG